MPDIDLSENGNTPVTRRECTLVHKSTTRWMAGITALLTLLSSTLAWSVTQTVTAMGRAADVQASLDSEQKATAEFRTYVRGALVDLKSDIRDLRLGRVKP